MSLTYTQEKDYWILEDITAPNCLIVRLIFCPFYLLVLGRLQQKIISKKML